MRAPTPVERLIASVPVNAFDVVAVRLRNVPAYTGACDGVTVAASEKLTV